MYRGRSSQRIEMPAFFRHRVSDLVDVQFRRLGPECDDRSGRGAKYIQFRDGICNGVGNRTCARNNLAARLEITTEKWAQGLQEQIEGENNDTYSEPMYCIAAQVPAINAPGLRARKVSRKNDGTKN